MGASQRRWLTGLLVAWAALLFGGFLLGSGADITQRMPAWTRMGSSLVLVAVAWSWFIFGRRGPTGRFALLLAAGMTCGLVGDLVLAGLLPGGENVLAGIAAFGLGHVCYITAALGWSNRAGLDDRKIRWVSLVVWWAIGLGGWYFVVFRGQDATVLHWAALPYALLLASTAAVATALAVQDWAYVPFAVGGALFLVSDLILAAELFNDAQFRLMGDVIWFTYGVGQMLIVMTAGAARSLKPAGSTATTRTAWRRPSSRS
jgi:YhhN family